jgi:deoxyribose-phosphate aldolase
MYCRNSNILTGCVANYGWIKSWMWKEVEEDIKAVCNACHKYDTL